MKSNKQNHLLTSFNVFFNSKSINTLEIITDTSTIPRLFSLDFNAFKCMSDL